MDEQYLLQLPDDMQNDVLEIERCSGIDIRIEIEAGRRETLACQVDKDGAKLVLPREHFFPHGSVLHELLHIRRFLLEGAPQLVANDDYDDWTPELESALTILDNSLEHLVIVPRELIRFPERRAHWVGVVNGALRGIRFNPLGLDDRQRHAMVNWLFVQHVLPGGSEAEEFDRLIDELGVRQRTATFRDAVLQLLQAKEDAVQCCFEHLQLPIASAALMYLDSHGHSAQTVPLGRGR